MAVSFSNIQVRFLEAPSGPPLPELPSSSELESALELARSTELGAGVALGFQLRSSSSATSLYSANDAEPGWQTDSLLLLGSHEFGATTESHHECQAPLCVWERPMHACEAKQESAGKR